MLLDGHGVVVAVLCDLVNQRNIMKKFDLPPLFDSFSSFFERKYFFGRLFGRLLGRSFRWLWEGKHKMNDSQATERINLHLYFDHALRKKIPESKRTNQL